MVKHMRIGKRDFDLDGHTYIMGILNVTPDSFSDGGRYNQLDAALRHAEQMIREGADILDIGGESTRPGYTIIPAQEEIERVVPIIRAVKERFDIPISIDTYKSAVAEAAIQAGADLVNDIWGLKYDTQMAEVIAKYQKPSCLMHNQNTMIYQNFIGDVLDSLKQSLSIAQRAGIDRETIILDPGIGFAKTFGMNLQLTNSLERLLELDCPILLGASRKSMIGLALDLPSDQRLEGTIAVSVIGVMKGCSFIRVHDVKENLRAVRMTEAVLHSGKL